MADQNTATPHNAAPTPTPPPAEPPLNYEGIPNLSTLCGFILGAPETLEGLKTLIAKLFANNPSWDTEDPDSLPDIIKLLTNTIHYHTNLTHNQQQHMDMEGLRDKIACGVVIGKLEGEGVNATWKGKPKAKGSPISSMLGNTLTIPLYRAGIWVTMKYPTRYQMFDFFKSANLAKFEFGRRVGAYHNYALPFFMIEQFFNYLSQMIVDSNFAQWRDPAALRSVLTFNDIIPLVWGAVCLIYPRGLHLGMYCTACDYKDTPFLNPSKLMMYDREQIHAAATEWMAEHKTKEVTFEEVMEYQNKLMYISEDVRLSEDMTAHLTVPHIDKFLSIMEAVVDRLEQAVSNSAAPDIPSITASEVYNMHLPWVDYIEFKDGETVERRHDRADIIEALECPYVDNSSFPKAVPKFIQKSTVNYVLRNAIMCPGCKRTVAPEVDNYSSIDCLHVFFAACCRMVTVSDSI